MRVRAERCASLARSARTLTPTPLPRGEGLSVATRANAATTCLVPVPLGFTSPQYGHSTHNIRRIHGNRTTPMPHGRRPSSMSQLCRSTCS